MSAVEQSRTRPVLFNLTARQIGGFAALTSTCAVTSEIEDTVAKHEAKTFRHEHSETTTEMSTRRAMQAAIKISSVAVRIEISLAIVQQLMTTIWRIFAL